MSLNNNFANLASEIRNMSSAPIKEINQEIEKTPQKIGMAEQDVLNLAEKLKEVEAQCRAMGDTAQANKLKEMLKMINAETTDVKGSMNELRQYIEKTFGTDALKQFDKELKNIDKTTSKVGKKSSFGSSLKTALGIGTVALGIRKAIGFVKEATTESINFVETQNLFNVSMGKTVDQYGNLDREASKYYTKAMAFQEKLSDKLKINIEESMEYQALFNAMSKSMGIGDEPSYKISENFTKLGYDLSSLYNIDPENAMQKLRAGLSGQTKPLRDLGLDITQQSLEPLLDELGIERSTKQLSQAEKMIARYIVVLRQASLAHGDFAKTMDSPANQLRIFNAQITAFKRNMGNLWQGLLGNILPYVNAIMMVINELLKMVAKLFGFEVSDQNVNISAGIGADDLADDLGTATGKAKELKKQLMGFDEINNITLPDNSSSGTGGASVGGIDQRLLDAMKEYDNMMDKVKSKANDIKDKMMEWLGFHREDDSWKLNEELTNAEKILDVMKMIGVAIGTWKVSKTITDLMHNLGIINKADAFKMAFGITLTATGIFAQYKGTKHLLNGDIDIFTLLETFLGTAAGTWGIVNILKATKFGKTLSLGNQIKVGLGIMLAVQAVQVIADGMKTKDLQKQIIGTLELGGATFLGLSGIVGWKVALPIALGVTVTATIVEVLGNLGAFDNEYKTFCDQVNARMEEINKDIQEYLEVRVSIVSDLETSLAEIGYIQQLVGELDNLVDTNGKVKAGYEDRVAFILNKVSSTFGEEYKLVDGQITKNGELINSYDEVKKSIEKTIEAKKAEIYLKASEELWTEAVKKRLTLTKDLNEAQKKQTEAQKKYDDCLKEFNKTSVITYDSLEDMQKAYKDIFTAGAEKSRIYSTMKELEGLQESINKTSGEADNAKKALQIACEDIVSYEDFATTAMSGDIEKIEKKVRGMTETYQTEGNLQVATLQDQVTQELAELEAKKKIWEEKGKEITENDRKQMEERLRNVVDNLVKQTNIVTTLGEDEIEAWKKLAEGSEQIYNEKISNVNEDTRLALEAILGKVDINSPDYIQKWTNMANESNERYNQALANLPEDTRGKIVASVMAVTGMTESTKTAYENLSEAGKNAFNSAMSSMDTDTRNKVQFAINEINNQSNNAYNTSWAFGNSINRGANDGQGNAWKLGRSFSQGYINGVKSLLNLANSAGKAIAQNAAVGVAVAQNSHSPSKVAEKLGNFFGEGYTGGIKDTIPNSVKSAEELVQKTIKVFNGNQLDKISINPEDLKIDTNQFIDYGQISGAIATQSNVKVSSNIEGRIENAIYRGLSNATIPVEIEATTDEGVIFKKVQTKAREFYTQTGEPAFGY